MSSSIGVSEGVATPRVFSTVETDVATPRVVGLLQIGVSWWQAPVEELVVSTRSSMNVLLPNARFCPRPRPPAMLAFCGVLGFIGMSRCTLLVFMQPKTCKLKKTEEKWMDATTMVSNNYLPRQRRQSVGQSICKLIKSNIQNVKYKSSTQESLFVAKIILQCLCLKH